METHNGKQDGTTGMIRMSNMDNNADNSAVTVPTKDSDLTEGMKIPDWTDMPKPEPLIVLSWEDIYHKANEIGVTLTKEQVTSIFHTMSRRWGDDNMDHFWQDIEEHINGD